MKNITPIEYDNEKLYDNIVKKKNIIRADKLKKISRSVKKRYQDYIKNTSKLHLILPDSIFTEYKNDLISCYSHNLHFDLVRPIIYKNVNKCPYCRIERPYTLDHYFDKSNYPEFSVFTNNLIPCCSTCNNEKGTDIIDENDNRLFIHFYYDTLPTTQFLFFRFSINNDNVPNIKTYLQFQECNLYSKIIKNHFDKLNLLEKYKKCSTEKLSEIINIIQSLSSGFLVEDIRKFIEADYKSKLKLYGINYYETCIYEGVLNSPQFIDSHID